MNIKNSFRQTNVIHQIKQNDNRFYKKVKENLCIDVNIRNETIIK